jgi:NADH dehydrogenase
VRASPLLESLGTPLLADGRVPVESDLTVPGRPEVTVVGDAAAVRWKDGWAPGVASAAIQMGRHAARDLHRVLAGRPRLAFRYAHQGMLATVGRGSAVADLGRVRVGGLLAWALWAFVHVAWLIGFRNRFAVLFQWAWVYLTWQRSARIILDEGRGPGFPATGGFPSGGE